MRVVSVMLCALFAAAALTSQAHPANPPSTPKKIWWVFLEAGKTPEPTDKALKQQMMKAHLGNFGRLAQKGDLVAAGPMADPAKVKEGIVVLTVGSRKQVADSFLPDQFVQQGMLAVHAVPMDVQFGRFAIEKVAPKGIDENRLVVLTNGTGRADKATQRAHLSKLAGLSGLAFDATTRGKEDIREIAAFRGTDETAIKSWLDSDPLVRGGFLKAAIYRQWFGTGLLGP